MIGTSVGHYRLEAVLGSGTYGTVYRAVNAFMPDIQVALKLVHGSLARDAAFVEALHRECAILHRMQHLGIVGFRDLLHDGPNVAMVLELLDGSDLHAMLARGQADPDETRGVLHQSLAALAYAHAMGVVHRDIKPGNVFRCADGRVKLIDFGVSKAAQGTQATATGQVVGTFDYMAPERFQGKAPPVSDLYALGLVAWELVAGRRACPEGDLPTQLGWHMGVGPSDVRVERPDCPDDLAEAIARLTARNPGDRPQTADAALALLHTRSASAERRYPVRQAAPSTVQVGRQDVDAAMATVAARSAPRPSAPLREVAAPRPAPPKPAPVAAQKPAPSLEPVAVPKPAHSAEPVVVPKPAHSAVPGTRPVPTGMSEPVSLPEPGSAIATTTLSNLNSTDFPDAYSCPVCGQHTNGEFAWCGRSCRRRAIDDAVVPLHLERWRQWRRPPDMLESIELNSPNKQSKGGCETRERHSVHHVLPPSDTPANTNGGPAIVSSGTEFADPPLSPPLHRNYTCPICGSVTDGELAWCGQHCRVRAINGGCVPTHIERWRRWTAAMQ